MHLPGWLSCLAGITSHSLIVLSPPAASSLPSGLKASDLTSLLLKACLMVVVFVPLAVSPSCKPPQWPPTAAVLPSGLRARAVIQETLGIIAVLILAAPTSHIWMDSPLANASNLLSAEKARY